MNPSRPLQLSVFFATLTLFISLAWFYTWANKLEVSQCITIRTFQLNLEWQGMCHCHCVLHSSHRMMGTLLASVDFIDGWWESPQCPVLGAGANDWYHYPVVSWDSGGWHQPGLSLTDTEPEWRLRLEAGLCIAACSGGGLTGGQAARDNAAKLKCYIKLSQKTSAALHLITQNHKVSGNRKRKMFTSISIDDW